MSRKVSMWIVVVLVGALAAMTAAVVVLATDDDGRAPATAEWSQGYGLSDDGSGRQGDSDSLALSDRRGAGQIPMLGAIHDPWHRDGGGSMLPWVLFAVATGTSVGLLIAWSPWRTAPAVPPHDGESGESDAAAAAATPTELEAAVAAPEDETTAPTEDEAATCTS
jgi:hypothetical protein